MTKEREALKLAQRAIEAHDSGDWAAASQLFGQALPAIKEALAQPEQGPSVKTVWVVGDKAWQQICATQEDVHKLVADMGMNTPSLYPSMSEVPVLSYTTPPQRKPLTFEQRMRICNECGDSVTLAILLTEAAHGIKE